MTVLIDSQCLIWFTDQDYLLSPNGVLLDYLSRLPVTGLLHRQSVVIPAAS